MSDLTKIAVDAMGGDGSPKKIIDGIIHSHKLNKKNYFKIFGNKIKIETLIKDELNNDSRIEEPSLSYRIYPITTTGIPRKRLFLNSL